MAVGADGAYGRASTRAKTEERKISACKRNKPPRELQRGSCDSLIHKAQKLGYQTQLASDRLETSKGSAQTREGVAAPVAVGCGWAQAKTYFGKGFKNPPGRRVCAVRLESPSLDSTAPIQRVGRSQHRWPICGCRVDANPAKSDDFQELCDCVQG